MTQEERKNFELEVKEEAIKNNNDVIFAIQRDMINLYEQGRWTGDTIEVLNQSLPLDPFGPYLEIFGRDFKFDYLKKEHDWYMSESLSTKGYMDDIKIWNFCASKDGHKMINSNYGYLVFNDGNYNQYDYCLNRLISDENTREAMIIYTRPSIQFECQEKGKHDFICTNYAHFFIRENQFHEKQLLMTVSQRSCDIITGLSFDFPWHCLIYQMMLSELKKVYSDLKAGIITYNIDSLHFYRRSEDLVKKYANRWMTNQSIK